MLYFTEACVKVEGHQKIATSVADPGFPRGGGANPEGGGANLIFGQKFPENCMKMKEFGPRGGKRASLAPPPPLDPPTYLMIMPYHGQMKENQIIVYCKCFCDLCFTLMVCLQLKGIHSCYYS